MCLLRKLCDMMCVRQGTSVRCPSQQWPELNSVLKNLSQVQSLPCNPFSYFYFVEFGKSEKFALFIYAFSF